MEIQSRHSELSVISQVSAVEGCPLIISGVPLYTTDRPLRELCSIRVYLKVNCGERKKIDFSNSVAFSEAL